MNPADDSAPVDAILAKSHPRHGWVGMAGHWPQGVHGLLEVLRAHPGASPLAVPELARQADTVALTPRHLHRTGARWLVLVTEDGTIHVDAIRRGTQGARVTRRVASVGVAARNGAAA